MISTDGVYAEVMGAPGCGEMDATTMGLLTALLGAEEGRCGLGELAVHQAMVAEVDTAWECGLDLGEDREEDECGNSRQLCRVTRERLGIN